jgi:outer membrane protein
MMKTFVRTALFAALLAGVGSKAHAQKFGYVNSALILSEMPEMKVLQSSLEAYQTILRKDGEAKVAALQQKEQTALRRSSAAK